MCAPIKMITTPAIQTPPTAQGFAAVAKLCAGAALAAYSGHPTIVGRNTSTQVLILSDFDRTVVSFRGTQEIEDWITDAQFELETFFYGRIHAGAKEALYDVFPRILSALSDVNPELPLYITGHSLGGLLAVPCAAMLQDRDIHVAGVFTFGQPRVGNKEFAQHYDQSPLGAKTYHFINGMDIVPRLPGAALGYRHCGQSYFFSEQGVLELNPRLWAMWLSDLSGFWQDLRKRHELSLLAEHRMALYQEKVNGL